MLAPAPRSLVLSALLWLPGCAKLQELLGDDTPAPRSEPSEDVPDVPPDLGDGEAPPEPLLRAEKKLRFPGKSGEHMGFDLARLSHLRALAGAIEVPEWSDPGEGSARHAYDDDLRTTWTCRLGPERACAIGLHFPRPAEAEAIRLFVAKPAKGAWARPRRVRLHTDEGWADAKLADEDGLWNVQLGEPVRTLNLTLELMEAHADAPIHLAELEVFGREGVPRPPLVVDVTRRAIAFEPPVWRKKSRTHEAGVAHVEQVDVDGRLRRVVPGTALIGHPGDRLLLVEHADWSTCDDHQGTYELLDTETRVMVPLGDMGGFAGQVFRHTEGLGFAMGRIDGDDAQVQAVVIDEGQYERRTTNRLERSEPREKLAAWSIDDTPLSRSDAHPAGHPSLGCEPATAERLDALASSLPKRTKLDPAQWSACPLGEGSWLLVSPGDPCGKEWHVAVIDDEGAVVGALAGKEPESHLRLRRLDGETLLVEQWGSKDAPRLFQADRSSLVQVEGTLGFSMRPPVGCRKRCDTEFSDLGPGK